MQNYLLAKASLFAKLKLLRICITIPEQLIQAHKLRIINCKTYFEFIIWIHSRNHWGNWNSVRLRRTLNCYINEIYLLLYLSDFNFGDGTLQLFIT